MDLLIKYFFRDDIKYFLSFINSAIHIGKALGPTVKGSLSFNKVYSATGL